MKGNANIISPLRNAIRAICFILVLITALLAASYMLAPKDNTKRSGINNPNANGFFSEPKNTIDIAVIGNSDAYSGFSPMELWNGFGYTSYVSAEGRQTVSGSLSMLKKILSCQSPKLVILETDNLFTPTGFSEDVANVFNRSMGSTFSVFQYHDRWKHAKPHEMLRPPKYTAHCETKGQMLSNEVKGYIGGEYMVPTDKEAPVSLANRTALDSFVSLCRQKKIEVMFLEIPSESSWNYKKHNSVKAYAEKNNIHFLDLNINREKFYFDWRTDTRDKGNHLNNRGARKVTKHVGEFVKNNYRIDDRRSDEAYKSWNEDFSDYSKKIRI